MRSRVFFVVLALTATALLTVACGGDDDDDGSGDLGTTQNTPTPFPNDESAEPTLDGPASLYSIAQSDLGVGYITEIASTFVLTADADSYGGTTPFEGLDGPALLREWGYLGGYETGYEPEGRERAVLNGSYYIGVETHLFEDAEGAKALFNHFHGLLDESVSDSLTVNGIGNDYGAWRVVSPDRPVSGSSVPSETHRYMFRRGNLVAVVLTWGAENFMDVKQVYNLAHIVDGKAMGEIETVEPTPVALATGD